MLEAAFLEGKPREKAKSKKVETRATVNRTAKKKLRDIFTLAPINIAGRRRRNTDSIPEASGSAPG